MPKRIILIVILLIIIGIGYWVYQPKPKTLTEAEKACINSGGQLSTSMCCKSVSDFSNLCLIGACGCSPADSHQVKTCDCGDWRCFDGKECVQQQLLITIYCLDNNCSAQQISQGAGTLAQDCYRNLNECLSSASTTCQNDSDCIGATCCHPDSCINKAYRGVCNVFCTQVCQGPLDCGAGSCGCVNHKCAVIPK